MNEPTKLSIAFDGPNNSVIRTDLRFSGDSNLERPLLIVCHGFKGFKDHSFFPHLSEKLAQEGFITLAMNFSHNGVGESLQDFDELEKFAMNSFAMERQDIGFVLDQLVAGALSEHVNFNSQRIALIGHSRGGAAVISAAAQHDQVSSVATLASLSRLPSLSADEQAEWRSRGLAYVENKRTNQKMPLGLDLLEELVKTPDLIEQAARTLNKPLLVIHGDQDETVKKQAALELVEWCEQAELCMIEGASHTFNTKHPFEGPSDCLDAVISALAGFFKKQLNS